MKMSVFIVICVLELKQLLQICDEESTKVHTPRSIM